VHVGADYIAALDGLDLADIAITSAATLVEGPVPDGAFTLPDVAGVGVVPALAEGEKCERCWKVLPDVGTHPDVPGVCGRCAEAVQTCRPAA
jgi:isoleucyl-tRNA synthetase